MRKVQGPLSLISSHREARRTPVSCPLFPVTCSRLSRVREVMLTTQHDFPDTRQNREENKLARRHVRLVIDHLQPSFED
jgi:hypothetical protein